MKKKIALCGLVVLMGVAALRLAPQMVQSGIPSIYYVTPNIKTYENVVSCAGTVQAQEVRELYIQSSLVAREVLVSVGDQVHEGEVLVRVDQEMTQDLSAGLDLLGSLPADTAALAEMDFASLITAYGISSYLGGESIDLEGILSLLTQGTAGTGSGSSSAVPVDAPEEITAPLSGVVTEVSIQAQVPASAGRSVLTIAGTDSYLVVASVDEGDIAKIRLGDSAKIRGVGFGGSSYTGTVTKIYPTARRVLSGTTTDTVVDVEITLDSPDQNLKPGFTAKVEIAGGNTYELLTVPYEAIRQDENNNEYVYVYEDGKLNKNTVVTGQELTNEVEILGGLDYDSIVIYNPDDVAKEGTMIQIKGKANVD